MGFVSSGQVVVLHQVFVIGCCFFEGHSCAALLALGKYIAGVQVNKVGQPVLVMTHPVHS